MTKRCRKSILCRPRRGRCCFGGTVFVVLHFRHLRIALSSAEALRGFSTNSQRLSPNQALHLSSMKAEHQTHRCCTVSFCSPQNLPPADSQDLHSTAPCRLPGSSYFRSAHASCLGPCGGLTRRERLTLSSRDSSLHSPLLASSSDLSFYPRKWWPGTHRIFMVHLSCLSSIQDAPQFPHSSLCPSFALIGNHCRWPEQSH